MRSRERIVLYTYIYICILFLQIVCKHFKPASYRYTMNFAIIATGRYVQCVINHPPFNLPATLWTLKPSAIYDNSSNNNLCLEGHIFIWKYCRPINAKTWRAKKIIKCNISLKTDISRARARQRRRQKGWERERVEERGTEVSLCGDHICCL